MEQRCYSTLCRYLYYKIAIFSSIHMKERVVNNHFYHMVHTKEEGTYHRIEKLTKEMPGFLSPGKGLPLLLIPEYSGINKEQRIPDRSKTAHRKPPVKCFLTLVKNNLSFKKMNFPPRFHLIIFQITLITWSVQFGNPFIIIIFKKFFLRISLCLKKERKWIYKV